MNIYLRKRRWKLGLSIIAVLIIGCSLWYTNMLVRRFAENERTNVTIWANAIQNNARLVSYADEFFENIRVEEEKRAELLAETYKRIANDNGSKDLTFYVDIIRKNTTIPVILTTADDRIINYVNVEEFKDSIPKILSGNLKDKFTEYKPIIVNYSPTDQHKLYYKESLIFTELRNVLDDLIESFFSEVVTNSVSVPVIITDQSQQQVYAFGNLDSLKMQEEQFVTRKIQNMRFDNKPIEIQLPDDRLAYIFYTDSLLLTQIQLFPYVQFAVIGIFFFIGRPNL